MALDIELAKDILEKLNEKKLVETNSPKYKISPYGKKLIALVHAILPATKEKINQDTYFSILSGCSSTIVLDCTPVSAPVV